MPRAPFQILGIPFRKSMKGIFEFAVFLRSDASYYQFIAGGGEENETPMQTLKREAREEADIPGTAQFHPLKTITSIPVHHFKGWENWGKDVYVIPEYSFAIDCEGVEISISEEHTECRWAEYEEAMSLLRYDGNKTALWEVMERLKNGEILL